MICGRDGCENEIPTFALKYRDGFCSTECAKIANGVPLPKNRKRQATSYTAEQLGNERRIRGSENAIPHGTENGYVNYGCKCGLCREAKADATRRRREGIGRTG